MPNKPGYYDDWYAENKEALSDRRKEKYKKNTEYRQKNIKRSSEYRKRQRDVTQVRVPRHQKPRIFKFNGFKIPLYSIGAFAGYINRSIQSINHWESKGLLPRTPYRVGKRGFRYYSAEMMEAVYEVVGNKRRLFPSDKGMGDVIRDAWEALGIPMDCKEGINAAFEQSAFRLIASLDDAQED